MFFLLVLFYLFTVCISAYMKNQFFLDYFNSKKVKNVLGFTCNGLKDDLALITLCNKQNIAISLHKLTNLTSIKILGKTSYHKLGIFLDIGCYEKSFVKFIFSEASDNWMFSESHYWLVFGPSITDILELVEDRSFGQSTDFVISTFSNKDDFLLYDIYNSCKERGGLLNITLIGNWNENTGMNVTIEQDKFSRRSNLHGLIFRSIYFKLKAKPLNVSLDHYLQEYKFPIKEGLSKYCHIILSHLSDLYNFTLQAFEAAAPQQNDSFGVHARILAKNLVDITGSPLFITNKRLDFMQFTHLSWPFRSCFIFRNPQPQNIQLREILRPLSLEIWYFTAAFMAISIFNLVILFKFENHNGVAARFSDSILLTIGSLCQQGTIERVTRMSTRVATLFIMIFAILIFDYYSSSFVSSRLNEQIFKINDSLLEFGKLRLGMASEWLPFLKILFSYPDPQIKNFYENHWLKTPEDKWYLEPEVGMELVRKGGFAYHTTPDTGYPIIEHFYSNNEVCELMEVHLTQPKLTYFALRYNSTIAEITRVGLTKISEVGLRQRNLIKWKRRKLVCRMDILTASSISLHEFSSHLILLVIGIILSIILCVTEVFIFSCGTSVRKIINRRLFTSSQKNLIVY